MALLPPLPAKYKGHLAVSAAGLIALVLFAVYGEHGLHHLIRLQAEQSALEQVAFQLQQQNEQLRQHIWRSQWDDAYIERQARERLGLVKPGEIVYRRSTQKQPPQP